MDFFQKLEIKYIALNKFFLMICDIFQNLIIIHYLIVVNIKANLKYH